MPFKVSAMMEIDDSSVSTINPDETTMEAPMLLLSPPPYQTPAPRFTTTSSSINQQSPLQHLDNNLTSCNRNDPIIKQSVDPDETFHFLSQQQQQQQQEQSIETSTKESQFYCSSEAQKTSGTKQRRNVVHCDRELSNNVGSKFLTQCSHQTSEENDRSPTKPVLEMGPNEKEYKYSYCSMVQSLIAKHRHHVQIPQFTSSSVDQRISNLYQCMEETGVTHTLNKLGIKCRYRSQTTRSKGSLQISDASHSDRDRSIEPEIMDEDVGTNAGHNSESTVGTSNVCEDYGSKLLSVKHNNPSGACSRSPPDTTPLASKRINETAIQFTRKNKILSQDVDSAVSPIELVRGEGESSLRRTSSFRSPNLHSSKRSSIASKKRVASTSGKKGTDIHRMRLEDETSFHPIYEEFSQAVNQIMNSPSAIVIGNNGRDLCTIRSSPVEEDDSSFLDSALFSQSPISHRDSVSIRMDQSMDLLTQPLPSNSKTGMSTQSAGKEIVRTRVECGNNSDSSVDTVDGYQGRNDREAYNASLDYNASLGMLRNGQHKSDASSPESNGRDGETSRDFLSKKMSRSNARRKSLKESSRARRSSSLDYDDSLSSLDNSVSGKGAWYNSTSAKSDCNEDKSIKDLRLKSNQKKGMHQRPLSGSQASDSVESFNSMQRESQDVLESPCGSIMQGNDSIESVDSNELREKIRKTKYNDDESIAEDDDYQECSIALKDNSRLYYDPLHCYRAPTWAKTYEQRKKQETRRKRNKKSEIIQICRRDNKAPVNECKALPTMTLIQEPFKEFGSRNSERLEVVSDWLKERDTSVGTKSHSTSRSLAGKAIVLSVSEKQIVALTLNVLVHNDVHKISRHNRHVDADVKRSDEGFIPESTYAGTLIVAKAKEDLVQWECTLREKTGFTVLNHAQLSSTERRRVTMSTKASGFDIVLTTYDALKTKEVPAAVDMSGRAIQQTYTQGEWLSTRETSRTKEQDQCTLLNRLHFLKWYRLVFIDDLGRQSYLTKPGTARANAASSLRGSSTLIFFEKSCGNNYFFEDKLKESRRQLVPLAKIFDVPENRTAEKLVGEIMLDFRDVKEEDEQEMVSDCESKYSSSSISVID